MLTSALYCRLTVLSVTYSDICFMLSASSCDIYFMLSATHSDVRSCYLLLVVNVLDSS